MGRVRKVIASDGVELAVHDLGGRGPLLLVGHATGYCSGVWRPVVSPFLEGFRCIGIDGRAHGLSGRPSPERFSRSLLASDVVDVIRELGATAPVYGAGHSAGATGLLLAEAENPGLFEALWAFEPVFFPPRPPGEDEEEEPEFNPLATAARSRRWEFSNREEALAHYQQRAPFSRFASESLAAFVACGLVDRESGTGMRLACRPEDEARFYEVDDLEESWAKVERVGCPVTFATGDQPGAFGPRHAELLAGRIPYGQAEILPGLSHFGPFEAPSAVAASILDALGGGEG